MPTHTTAVPSRVQAGGVQLGTRTMQIDQLCDLPTTNYGGIRLRAVRQALALGDLRLADQVRDGCLGTGGTSSQSSAIRACRDDRSHPASLGLQERHVQWLDELEQLTKRQSVSLHHGCPAWRVCRRTRSFDRSLAPCPGRQVQVYLRLFPDVPGARQLRAYVLHNIKDATNRLYIVRTTSLINGVWKRSAQGAQGLTVVDVHALLRGLDGAAGSPAMQQMNRCALPVLAVRRSAQMIAFAHAHQ